jgi:hypothetical protein
MDYLTGNDSAKISFENLWIGRGRLVMVMGIEDGMGWDEIMDLFFLLGIDDDALQTFWAS